MNNNLLNDDHKSIVDKEDSESEVEEEISKVEEKLIQDGISDHYLDICDIKGITF